MIQSSRPIHGPSADSGVSPGVPGGGNKIDKTGKKGRLGAFARLLEGLTGKLRKKGEGIPEGSPRPGERLREKSGKVPGEKGGAENGFLWASSVFSPAVTRRAPQDGGVSPGGKVPGEAPAPRRGGPGPELREAGSPPVPGGKTGKAVPAGGEETGEIRLSKAVPGSLFTSPDSPVPGPLSPAGSVPADAEVVSPGFPETGGGPPKPAPRGAVDLLSGSRRNTPAPDFRFSGLPRPALVDTLNPRDRVREGRGGGKLPELRSKKTKVSADPASPAPEKPGEAPFLFSAAGGPESSPSAPRGGESEITVDLGKPAAPGGGRAGSPGQEPRTFEQALARELREGLNYDIVREVQILLRGGGEGTIRLSLRPETLGNIKIRLEMAENKIKGHIVLESGEAFRAFKQELAALEQAFRDSGFSDASLDMSLAQGEGGSGGGEGRRDGESPPFDPGLAASRYDEGSQAGFLLEPGNPGGFYGPSGTKTVNLLI